MTETKLKMNRPPKLTWVIWAFLGVLVLWTINGLYGRSLEASERGVFGDTFGAVNALYSGLAFVGVIYAILMQRYEISLAKEDAAMTKKILDDQSAHLSEQVQQERRRAFEDTFFKMLSLFNDVAESVTTVKRFSEGQQVYRGRHAMAEISENIYPQNFYVERNISDYDARLEGFNSQYGGALSHYFRNIESILTFLNVSHQVDVEFYSGILRGHLSDAEQSLIFHHCIRQDATRLKGLVERYHLLAGIKDEQVMFPELRSQYASSAFQVTYSLVEP